MRPIHRPALALLAGVAFAAPCAAAPGTTNPQQIRAVAERFIEGFGTAEATVQATAGPLDPRLTLAGCAGELTPFLPPGATVKARTTVGVRCPDAGGWSIYVPVAVETDTRLAVARRSLARGEMPSPNDLDWVSRKVPGLPTQFLARPADTGGRRLRRPVAAGAVIPIDALAAPVLVERGQQVTLSAAAAGIAVRATAVALDGGGFGDRVRVRNTVSGRVIEGSVQADGTVVVAH
jgi:flagella basal body P-ring formation protein FlgA